MARETTDVRTFLLTFDRAGLQGLVQDLYAASKDNQAFLHARFGLGPDQLGPYKRTISRWINPDLMKNQTVSVSKAKKAIADYNKAIGHPEGLAELSVFFCEEAFSFVEGCSFSDERYFVALIRMYGVGAEPTFQQLDGKPVTRVQRFIFYLAELLAWCEAADLPSGLNRLEKFRHSGKFSLRIKQRF